MVEFRLDVLGDERADQHLPGGSGFADRGQRQEGRSGGSLPILGSQRPFLPPHGGHRGCP